MLLKLSYMGPLKIRAYLQVNDETRKLVLSANDNETPEHLALKLAAFLVFWKDDPVVDPSLKSSALAGQALRPDLLSTNIEGSVGLWIDCGNTSENKLGKALRRWPDARIAVLKENERQALAQREVLKAKVPKSDRIQIYYFPQGEFKTWMSCLAENAEVIGEANDAGMNLVINENVFVVDMGKC
jgi:uncharacterized protein YaeQ